MRPDTTEAYFVDENALIYLADSRDVLPEITTESVDIVVTDPPYIVDYRGRWGSDWDPIVGDVNSDWLLPVFSELWRVLKPNSLCVTFYGWPNADLFLSIWKLIGFRPVSHLACIKNCIGLGHFTRSRHETAYVLAKGRPCRPKATVPDVFEWEREPLIHHPNQKPLRTIAQMLEAFSSENALVLDPFMGSGTTLLAARCMGRRAIGIEIEEQYCQIAAQRLSQGFFEFSPVPNEPPIQFEFPSLCSEDSRL